MNLQSTASSSMGSVGYSLHAGEILARRKMQPGIPLHLAKSEATEARHDVPIDDIWFCALQTEQDIRAIRHLREELRLPGSAVAEPEFRALEKKETSTGWWALSPAMTR
jgi:hypothetical protein